MDIINLVNIKEYCGQAKISRASFYRRVRRDEIEIYKIKGKKKPWVVSLGDERQQINGGNILEYNENNILEYLETQGKRDADMLARFDAENEKHLERLSKMPIV